MTKINEDCTPQVGHTLARNRYYTGQMLTAADFNADQEYFVSRKWLHNRLLHGFGIVCGLQVTLAQSDQLNVIKVSKGVAVDGCGREIILLEDAELTCPIAWQDETPGPQILCIRYCEVPTHFVPALSSTSGTSDQVEASRIQEKAKIVLKPLKEVDPHCWQGEISPCLEEDCSCQGLVPLAAIYFDGQEAGAANVRLDLRCRRRLQGIHQPRTHIEWINWPHGGELSMARLQSSYRGRLMVRFSAPIEPAGPAAGINEFTFCARLRDDHAEIKTLPGRAILLEDRRTAVFAFADNFFDNVDNLVDQHIEVNLKCDLILNHEGNPVDGNHLRGQLPTGNGQPGGDFFSWFRVSA